MSKYYKKQWGNEGVSTIVATILMVAMTVVLTSLLFVTMQQMSETTSQVTPKATVTTAYSEDGYNYTVWIAETTTSIEHKEVFIKVVINGNITIIGSTKNGLTEKLEVGNFTFDPLEGSHRLGAGDRFFMRGGSKYEWEDAEIAFIYIPTNGLLAQKYV